VRFGENVITTARDGGVNLSMYQFGIDEIEYSKPLDGKGEEFTPAVDVLCEWKGSGKQVLITVIVPYEDKTRVKNVKYSENGFNMIFVDGNTVDYRYHGNGEVEAELDTGKSRFILNPDGGFELNKDKTKLPGVIPEGFSWEETSEGEKPSYK
jgi:hypothetical protein